MKRLMENHLNEMAYERREAVNRCGDLGREFIEHFHKIYEEGKDSKDFHHHCSEMQTWYDDVSDITLKRNKKRLSSTQITDWFFTKGSSVEYLFDNEDEIDRYEVFIKKLDRGDNIEELLKKILS